MNNTEYSFIRDGIFIPKDLTKYKEEAIDHIFKDIEYLKTIMEGFLKAFNSLKTVNVTKSDFPMINANEFFFLQNKTIPATKSKRQNLKLHNSLASSSSKVNFEDKFYICVFQILLGDNIEYFYKNYDFNFFNDFDSLNLDVIKKIKENNSNLLNSIFINIEN